MYKGLSRQRAKRSLNLPKLNQTDCEICGSHGADYQNYGILGSNAMYVVQEIRINDLEAPIYQTAWRHIPVDCYVENQNASTKLNVFAIGHALLVLLHAGYRTTVATKRRPAGIVHISLLNGLRDLQC
jgi:hypothetical protein